jgi:hypothetical protein
LIPDAFFDGWAERPTKCLASLDGPLEDDAGDQFTDD